MATKAKGKPEPAKPNTNTLTVLAKPEDIKSAVIAQTLVRGRGGLSEAEPADDPAQAATKGNHVKRSHRAGCAASGGA